MKKVINIMLLVVLGVSLSGCEWFEHENSNKKDEVEIDTYATELISRGGSGHIVLIDEIEETVKEKEKNGRLVSKNSVIYKSRHNDSIPIDIDVKGLKYNPKNKNENNIKIRIGDNTKYSDYNIGSGGGRCDGDGVHFGQIEYNGKNYVMEEIFKLNPESDTLFIDFVCREGANKQAEIRDEEWAEQILTSSEIENIVYGKDKTKYRKTNISLSYTPNTLSRECYIIDGKIYTKSMLGDRWIYLANQHAPLGYITSTNETHMIACVELKEDKENDFDKYYKVVLQIKDNHCSNVVRDIDPNNPHIIKSNFNNL